MVGVSHLVVPESLWPHELYSTRLLCPWDFPGNNTGVGCHFLLQGIFPTQGSNPSLPHCMLFLYLWDIKEAHLSIVLLLQQPKRTKTLLQQPQQTMTPWSIVPSLNRLWSLGDVLVISFSDLVSHGQPHQGHLSYVPLSTPRYLSSHS